MVNGNKPRAAQRGRARRRAAGALRQVPRIAGFTTKPICCRSQRTKRKLCAQHRTGFFSFVYTYASSSITGLCTAGAPRGFVTFYAKRSSSHMECHAAARDKAPALNPHRLCGFFNARFRSCNHAFQRIAPLFQTIQKELRELHRSDLLVFISDASCGIE
jgi:hypothetical protein